jgi:hypothetical protein
VPHPQEVEVTIGIDPEGCPRLVGGAPMVALQRDPDRSEEEQQDGCGYECAHGSDFAAVAFLPRVAERSLSVKYLPYWPA